MVAAGLLKMGRVTHEEALDDILAQTLRDAPKISPEYGEHLEPVARTLPADPLLDSAVQLYERLVERAISGKNQSPYAEAGAICQVIQAIRRVQNRQTDFERYRQGLFATYCRYSALKDEIRESVKG